MNALKYVLLAGACIVGTTAVWSMSRSKLDCPDCKCNCPLGVPGAPGKPGMDCQLFDNNGRLACRYADRTESTSDIPTMGALGDIKSEAVPTYGYLHVILMVVFVLVWLGVLYLMSDTSKVRQELGKLQGDLGTVRQTVQTIRSRAA